VPVTEPGHTDFISMLFAWPRHGPHTFPDNDSGGRAPPFELGNNQPDTCVAAGTTFRDTVRCPGTVLPPVPTFWRRTVPLLNRTPEDASGDRVKMRWVAFPWREWRGLHGLC